VRRFFDLACDCCPPDGFFAEALPASASDGDATSDADLQDLFDKVKTWGRWGPDDERGTLNNITGAEVVRAAALVREGRTLSLSRNFPTEPGPENPWPAQHHMVIGGDDPAIFPGLETVTDYIGIAFHGMASSHIDALCHVFAGGQMYGGRPGSDVKSTGARANSIMALKDGVVGRGVLLDLPRTQGAPFIEADAMAGVEALEAAERAAGVTVGKGDILLVRFGRDLRRARAGDTKVAGMHPSVCAWLHERQVAVLGGDGVSDPIPPGQISRKWAMPIHAIALAGMGLHLLDNLDLDPLAALCAELGRWEFQLTLAPLRVVGGTGSPLNPIAVF
jgi:kynurenine formamidase